MTDEDVDLVVKAELALFRVPGIQEWAQHLLVSPQQSVRQWEYGSDGQSFVCWIVAKLPVPEWGIVFCPQGHVGNWGVVSLCDQWFGPDSSWFARLEDAFVAGGWDGALPAGYEVD